jgi:threonine synthase
MSSARELRCDDHGHRASLDEPVTLCPVCGSLMEYIYDLETLPKDFAELAASRRAERMWRWRVLFPLPASALVVSLGEGDTPLIDVDPLADLVGVRRLQIKNDAMMPTGSFKDRGFSLAVSQAWHLGLRAGFTYSSGNAGASFAAYAAHAGMRAHVFVEEAANASKVAAISLHGAEVHRLTYSSSAEIFTALEILAREGEYTFVNFVNPVRHEAMKTYAYEICESLDWDVPDVMVHPVGTGGGLWGAWKGFTELRELGLIDRLPRMVGVQAAACAPLVDAFERDRPATERHGDATKTLAQSIAGDSMIHGGRRVLKAIRDSGGAAIAVGEDELRDAVLRLGHVGIPAEPSAAAPVAALLSAKEQGHVTRSDTVVAVVTGSALKQPNAIRAMVPAPRNTVRADAQLWRTLLSSSADTLQLAE